MPLSNFKDQVAVVTGAASGIGLEIAKALAGQGARLVLADIEPGPLEAALSHLRSLGAQAVARRTDVARREDLQGLADLSWESFGSVNLVVHNAGVAVFGPTQEMKDEDWAWSMNVNLWGPIHGVQAFLPRMVAEGGPGHHVFTASFAGLVPNRNLGPYNVTKAGVVALAESLRKDLRGTGIGASVLCPMRVATNIDQSFRNRPSALGGPREITYSDEDRAALVGRTLDPASVANLVLDAVRDDQLYIHTHREAEPLFKGRADRILAAFDRAL